MFKTVLGNAMGGDCLVFIKEADLHNHVTKRILNSFGHCYKCASSHHIASVLSLGVVDFFAELVVEHPTAFVLLICEDASLFRSPQEKSRLPFMQCQPECIFDLALHLRTRHRKQEVVVELVGEGRRPCISFQWYELILGEKIIVISASWWNARPQQLANFIVHLHFVQWVCPFVDFFLLLVEAMSASTNWTIPILVLLVLPKHRLLVFLKHQLFLRGKLYGIEGLSTDR